MADQQFRLVIQGGTVDARMPLVALPVTELGMTAPLADSSARFSVTDEATGQVSPAQISADGSALEWVAPGTLESGARRSVVLRSGAGDASSGDQASVTIVQKLDRLLFKVDGTERARYTFLGARRPYFWPVTGPAGQSVVRGQGSEDHPHHTGLTVAYGGHGEGGSTNIWSDWDEGPYGPCGRMVHRGFRDVRGGPVYGEVVEDLTYLRVDGEPMLDEVRRIRVWAGPAGSLLLDLTLRIRALDDAGTHPFLLAARLPAGMDIPGAGRVMGSDGPRPTSSGPFQGRWVDGSGPAGAAWQGIALLDHPDNAAYPGDLCKYAVAPQITLRQYPPTQEETSGQSFTIRWRVFVHEGDAQSAGVDQHWAAFASEFAVTREP